MEDNIILPRIETYTPDIVLHESLLSLLESSDDITVFCHSCELIVRRYVRIGGLVVMGLISHTEPMKIIYQKLSQQPSEKCLSSIVSLGKHYYNELYRFNSWYIFPIKFKNKYLGNLLIEIEDFYLEQKQGEGLLSLLVKYLGLYIYQQNLSFRENCLTREKGNIDIAKENHQKYLSYINHELRTPITAVIGFAKMLKQQLYGSLNAKQSQYVEAIYQSGQYLLDLVNDLLDLSKLEAEKEDLSIEKIVVRELCESCLDLVKTRAKERNLELILKIADHIEVFYGDYRRIKQILVNLLSNAVKFTEKGSVSLNVIQNEEYLLFQVIDTGIGISLDSQRKLFVPFSQLNTHLHRQCKGTGLGLVIAQKLARLHGGDLTMVSEENKGSCFTLSIPNNIVISRLESSSPMLVKG